MKTTIGLPVVLAGLLAAGLPARVQAQKLFFVFVHGQYATPSQTSFKDNYNFGLGAEGGAGIGFGKTFFTGTVGYTVFDAKSNTESGKGNLTYVPMKLGIRRYFLPGHLLFVHADAGVAHIKEKSAGSYSRFTGDVGAGVKLGPLEAGVAYDGFSQSDPSGFASWIGFKLGWRFGL
jgi:hypothetical protein